MKPTKAQIAVGYAASISLMLGIFHRPLGLADYWEWIFDGACFVLWIAFFVIRRRHKAALSAAGAGSPSPSRANKKTMWLIFFILAATSLSSFLWLPYTGVVLPPTQLIIVSIISCILSLGVFFIAWRRRDRV
jgi:hypothetical protein